MESGVKLHFRGDRSSAPAGTLIMDSSSGTVEMCCIAVALFILYVNFSRYCGLHHELLKCTV